jgi:hypothetical protein
VLCCVGCLSFTADVWKSPNGQPFLGITVHWIGKDWQIHSLLMDMVPISGKHTGEKSCGLFKKACSELGVLPKLLAVTVVWRHAHCVGCAGRWSRRGCDSTVV